MSALTAMISLRSTTSDGSDVVYKIIIIKVLRVLAINLNKLVSTSGLDEHLREWKWDGVNCTETL